jgi:predicted O-linked N-acetylglucosamine transferase (SPINDLY family)
MLLTTENISLHEYWQAGIDQVLAGQDDEAQAIWLLPFLDGTISIDEEKISQSLIDYLSGTANQKIQDGEISEAYAITKCLCAVADSNINALLRLFNLSVQANEFNVEALADNNLVEMLMQDDSEDIDSSLIYLFVGQVTAVLTKQDSDIYIDFIRMLARKVSNKLDLINILAPHANALAQARGLYQLGSQILEVCLEHAPESLRFSVLYDLAGNINKENDYAKSIAISEQCYQEGKKIGIMQEVCGSHRRLAALMEAGEWLKIPAVAAQHKTILQHFIVEEQSIINYFTIVATPFFLNYLYDEPRTMHHFRNAIGDICLKSVNSSKKNLVSNHHYQSPPKNGLLRIGYIASTLDTHSVGWLSRWLFHYHDRSNLQVFIYHVGQVDNNLFNQKFFRSKANVSHYLGNNAEEIAALIKQDEIDILIDLDSLSMTDTYKVMCYKPAPISITWLGWDTSGCPAVDYFIADPYVLPADAEEYYRSKIWRLPQTYVAIDGFEVEVPTKRRSDYQIPEDSIVYLCSQQSYKHHPDILRLQIQVIKQVPNSYLMVQLRANPESLMQIYQQLTHEVGISMEQLRFIQPDPDEMTHRANLQLADVVLDTFPYNGATTTLETLWMGVPLVTKVGQAFVARNSYAFMQQVGVTEGIAYTDAEYVDWGVRLGTDLALRQQVMGKLLHSRKTSPLWNARSFTLEMENAYRQMWEIYQSQVLAQQK